MRKDPDETEDKEPLNSDDPTLSGQSRTWSLHIQWKWSSNPGFSVLF